MASIIEKMIRGGLRSGGFTLLETCMGIVIGGAALAGGVDIIKQYRAQEIVDINTARSTAIASALEGYMLKNGALPCPAARGIASDTPGYGVANCGVTSVPAGPNGPVLIGTLPTQNLGLPYEDMIDAWNHQFTYAVTAKLTNPTASPTFQMDPTKGAIDIIDPSAAGSPPPSLIMVNGLGKAAFFVVIGAGKDGAGAYTRDGAPPTVPCSAALGYDSYNCKYLTVPMTDATGLVFAQAPFSLAQGPHYFDNVVIYSNTVNKYDIPKCPANQYLVENPADPNQHQLMCVQKLTAPIPKVCPTTIPPTVLTSIPCPGSPADPACNLPGNAPMANILGYGFKCMKLPAVPPSPITCPPGTNLTTNGSAGVYTCDVPKYPNPVLPQCDSGYVLSTNASGAQYCRQVKITSQQVACAATSCPLGGCGSGTDDWGCVQTCPSGTVITGGFMEANNVLTSSGRISRMNSDSTPAFGVAGNSYYCLMNFAPTGGCTSGSKPCNLKCDAICSKVQ